MVQLLGPQDRLLRVVEREHPDVQVHVRGNEITLTGAAAPSPAPALVDELIAMARAVRARALRRGLEPHPPADRRPPVRGARRGDPVLAWTHDPPEDPRSEAYVDAIDENTIVFGIGPAGTGKTYLAMAKAVQALQRKEVDRIILTGRRSRRGAPGFLPGTLTDKIDPYLRPLYDALNEMMDPEIVPSSWRRARSRSRRSRTCADARSTTRSSCSTRRRTRRPSR
jgi:phosphate starvation-inducible PhoH-like protein